MYLYTQVQSIVIKRSPVATTWFILRIELEVRETGTTYFTTVNDYLLKKKTEEIIAVPTQRKFGM